MTLWSILFDLVLLAVCLVIAVADLRRGIIPNWCNATLAVAGALLSLQTSWALLESHLIDALLTLALFALVRYAYLRWRGYAGIGLGDVKFLAAAALGVGLTGVQILLLIACLTGLAEVLARKVLGQSMTARSKVRFGPHLAFGLLCSLYLLQSGFDLSVTGDGFVN
jgi:leader peptidase (prepilin peptidase) / N-methyltransferase